MAADTAPPAAGAGGITSPDYWEARWKQARADAAADTALAINGPEGHTASEWHSGRFRFETLSCTFAGAGAAALPRCSVILGGIVPAGRTTLAFDSVVFDPDGWANLAASTITVADEDDYLIFAGITWFAGSTDPSTGTRRDLMVYCTPTPNFFTPTHLSEIEPPRLASSGSIRHETMVPLHLTAGTVIQLRVDHDASGALLIGTNGNDRGMLTVMKVG